MIESVCNADPHVDTILSREVSFIVPHSEDQNLQMIQVVEPRAKDNTRTFPLSPFLNQHLHFLKNEFQSCDVTDSEFSPDSLVFHQVTLLRNVDPLRVKQNGT